MLYGESEGNQSPIQSQQDECGRRINLCGKSIPKESVVANGKEYVSDCTEHDQYKYDEGDHDNIVVSSVLGLMESVVLALPDFYMEERCRQIR